MVTQIEIKHKFLDAQSIDMKAHTPKHTYKYAPCIKKKKSKRARISDSTELKGDIDLWAVIAEHVAVLRVLYFSRLVCKSFLNHR